MIEGFSKDAAARRVRADLKALGVRGRVSFHGRTALGVAHGLTRSRHYF